jgi:two-component system, chemotaxis family, CheB/CheR fusion protein
MRQQGTVEVNSVKREKISLRLNTPGRHPSPWVKVIAPNAEKSRRYPETDRVPSHISRTRRDLPSDIDAEAACNGIHKPAAILDRKLHIVFANAPFFRFFETSLRDCLGRPLAEIESPLIRVREIQEFFDRLEAGIESEERCDLTVDLPSVGKRVLVVTGEEIYGAGVVDRKILVSFDDITEVQSAKAQLELAKHAAERANLAKSRFLAAASHDLRQPLQTLTLLQAPLKEEVNTREGQELLERVERTIDTMTGMLKTLLDINQLDVGVVRPKLTDFPIDDALMSLKLEFVEQIRRKDLDWHVVPAGLWVRSDPRLLQEMLRNLIANAIRYTDAGKILLGCRRHGDKVRIEVWDTGVGIAEHEIPQIFEEYRQSGGSMSRGGLGLGLAIVQHLGELLGHNVCVRSEVGKGSAFSIEVPVAVRDRRPAHARLARAEIGRERTGTILIVEDDPPVRESMKLMLEAEGHRVFATAGRDTALALVENGTTPDLIISDYTLSGVTTGTDVAQALRAAAGVAVPIIILTGDIRTATANAVAARGYTSLCKPVKAEDLARIIHKLLTEREKVESGAAQIRETSASDSMGVIFVIDDDRQAREAMSTLLERADYQVKSYASAQAFLDTYHPEERGCLLTDLRMPGMNGFELLAQVAAAGHQLPAIVITGQGDIATAVQAMRAGAVDFIEKPIGPDALLACIERTLRQKATSEDQAARHSVAALRLAGLTRREKEVMELVVDGHANKNIAYRLGISQRTVESHRAAVMKKMGASSLSDLVRLDMAAR